VTARPLLEHQRGTVFIEFLISFVPFFLLFLGTTQLCLMHAAQLVVHHAAVLAVRAAVVAFDDDPCFHGGEPRGVLPMKSRKGADGAIERGLTKLGLAGGGTGKIGAAGGHGGSRLTRVRNAAYLPLATLAPTPQQLAGGVATAALPSPTRDESVHAALGDHPAQRIASGFATYNRVASAITFPREPGSKELRNPASDAVGSDELVTVRVTYLFSCNVPVVRELMCDSFLDPRSLGGVGQLARELGHAEWKWLVPALLSPRNRFVALRAEATLPNQGAAYKYPSELGKCECEGMDTPGGAS